MRSGMEDTAGIGRRVVVATHRRSGTHLTLDLLRRHFAACRARKRPGQGLDALYLNLDRLGANRHPLGERQALARLRRAPRPLVKTHALPEHLAAWGPAAELRAWIVSDADLYCVVRDGRDVVCSLHAYVCGYDPAAPGSLSAFLAQQDGGLSRVARWAREVRRCLAVPGVRLLRYEDLVARPREALARLGRELALEPRYAEPLLPAPLRGRWQSRLARFARDPDATNVPGGASAPWRRAFSRADRELFLRDAGELLIELGYESSPAWVEGVAA